MLERVLQAIADGGIHTPTELAQELQVSEALLEAMVDELARLGYLRAVEIACSGKCNHCQMSASCSIVGRGRVWVLTDAGRRMTQY